MVRTEKKLCAKSEPNYLLYFCIHDYAGRLKMKRNIIVRRIQGESDVVVVYLRDKIEKERLCADNY